MDKGLYCDPMLFTDEGNTLNRSRRVSNINFFGTSFELIFDIEPNNACNPHKIDFMYLKIKINGKKLKVISEVLKPKGVGTV